MFRARFDEAPEIELDELVERVAQTVIPDDFESMKSCAPFLAGYARRKDILVDTINQTIEGLMLARTVAPTRTPQSFLLAVHDKFYIRCNIWAPISNDVKSKLYQERLYSLEVPHDHNFSFLTVGYSGPGYKTNILEHSRSREEYSVGDAVNLSPVGTYTLSPGDVMFYRQGIDVHVQHQPAELSSSINIIFISEYSQTEWQYIFDLKTATITGLSGSAIRSRRELIMLAAELGNAETIRRLTDLSARCPCAKTRQAALLALNNLSSA